MKALSILLCLILWQGSHAAQVQSPVGGKPACCATNPLSPDHFSDTSLYQLESTWTPATGKDLKLGELKGKVQVVTMFFTHCEFACPVLVHDMTRIEAALPRSIGTNVGFVLVSFDSERDTPEVLRAYNARMEFDTNRWKLLRGSSDDVLELAALLGIKFKKDVRGQFAHSNLITVLNPAGEIVHQQIGLNQEVTPTVEAISKAACKSQ
jgi:protein SCO1